MSRHVIIDSSGENIAKDMWERDTRPSELELRIRKEVMETVNKLDAELFKMQTIENVKYMEIIKDRLNLLWGSGNE